MKKRVLWVLAAALSFNGMAQTPHFNAVSAFDLLVKQCDFGPRHPGSEGHAACAEWMIKELKKSADQVVLQPFPFQSPLTGQRHTGTNIIAKFGNQSDRILLCAHWDTRPFADSDPDPANHKKPVMGASDGASGVAVLMQMARIFRENPPPVGVDIVLFDGEDSGTHGDTDSWCLGARYFAQNKPSDYWPRYAVLLDLIGDKDLQLPVERFSQEYAPHLVDQIWTLAENLGLSAFSKRVKYEVVDDHLELLKVGIPAVNIVDMDYEFWHTVNDIPENCSAQSLGTVGTLLCHLIYE